MPFAVDRLQHERTMHQDSVKVYRASDQTSIERQLGVLLLEGVIALGRVQGEADRQGCRIVVNVAIDGEDFLVDPVPVILDDLPPRAAVFIREAMLLEYPRDPLEYSAGTKVSGSQQVERARLAV